MSCNRDAVPAIEDMTRRVVSAIRGGQTSADERRPSIPILARRSIRGMKMHEGSSA